ncbi:MAG: hypothetical protein HYW02_06770 [Deltaproteobacteria bacterium]|nr:hypothetical protein [Deltaproteobacteria bacterium]MBI2501150.1 hypothetical protein [Deltaproteobacteria bacterium]
MTQCPLCQKKFDESTCCIGCGLRKGCTLIRCPSCQYEFVERSALVDLFQRVVRALRRWYGGKDEKTAP